MESVKENTGMEEEGVREATVEMYTLLHIRDS